MSLRCGLGAASAFGLGAWYYHKKQGITDNDKGQKKYIQVFFLRHGTSTWNVKHGTGDYVDVMKRHGLGPDAAAAAGVDWKDWHHAMRSCLHTPGSRILRDDPKSPPPEDVRGLNEHLTDPPLTLEGKRALRLCMVEHVNALSLKPFEVIVASPMLRTLQTATIAACLLPLAATCKWQFDADAREENHISWVDTWGTSSFPELRLRAKAEIAAAGCQAEDILCSLRAPMQQHEIASASKGPLALQAELLAAQLDGIKGFVDDMNVPVVPTAADKQAAAEESLQWAQVLASDPEFRFRVDGSTTNPQVVGKLSDDLDVQWWALNESAEDMRKRIDSLMRSDAISQSQGPALVVTHSMFIDFAIKALLHDKTRWVGPADYPALDPSQPLKLVANGGIFYALVDVSTFKAVEAGVTAWR